MFPSHDQRGATSVRLKKYEITIKGLYQLYDYQLNSATNTYIQNQSPSFIRVAEVNPRLLEGISNNNNVDHTPNRRVLYSFSDCHPASFYGFESIFGNAVTRTSNNLTSVGCRVPTNETTDIALAVQELQATALSWYPDIDKRAKKITMLGQNEDYQRS